MNKRRRRREKSESPRALRPIYLAFFLSGIAGLMHQVVWAKQLVQLVGSTAKAQAVVLAVFMCGLALGAWLFGRRVDRHGHPLRTFVFLEVGIGAYCLFIPLLLWVAGLGYTELALRFSELSGLKLALRSLLSLLVVIAPAVMMGATLPALARHVVGKLDETRRQVARLYALNSFGAVLGAGVAGFVALPRLGIYASLVAAALVNFVAALLVWRVARVGTEGTRSAREASAPPDVQTYSRLQHAVALIALALSGFAAMGYEVLFHRVIALSFGSSAYSFTVMLMCFIAGIALGSAIVSRLRVKNPLWVLGLSQLLVVVSMLAVTPLVSRWPYWIGLMRIALQGQDYAFALYQWGKAGLCMAVLLPPTVALGFGFPLVAQVQVRETGRVGTWVGSTYAWNTVGNVLGVVFTTLLLLPVLGLLGSFHLNWGLNLAAGLALLLVAQPVRRTLRVAAGAIAIAAVALYGFVGTGWTVPVTQCADHLRLRTRPKDPGNQDHPATSFEAWKRAYVRDTSHDPFFVAEDAYNTVLVHGPPEGRTGATYLVVNGKGDASTDPRDMDTQLFLAHAPLFMKPDARNVLVIGHGSGITAGSAMLHPVERLDIVEISSGVLEADRFFAEANNRVLERPEVNVYEDDGVSFLRTTPQQYDVIISEPSNPWMAGISTLFTREFFETARDKLSPGGVFTFWFHTYDQSDASVEMVMRTLEAVFPCYLAFADDDFGNVIAVASREPIEPDFDAMATRFGDQGIRADFARLGLPNLAAFLSHQRVTQDGTRRLTRPGPLNTMNHLRLEYGAPRSFFSGESSFFLEQFDPFYRGLTRDPLLLVDRYIDQVRSRGGNPAPELARAARYAAGLGGYGQRVAQGLRTRADRSRDSSER